MSTLQPYLTASAQLVLGTGGTLELQALPSAGVAAQLAPFYKGDKGDKGEQGDKGEPGDSLMAWTSANW